MSGPPSLVEWVKTALYESLKEEVLRFPLPRATLLTLTFRFTIHSQPPPIHTFSYNHTFLRFEIMGYKDNASRAKDGMKSLINGPPSGKSIEWNFSRRTEMYERACWGQNNKIACETLADMYEKAGMNAEYEKIQKKMKSSLKRRD